MCICTCSYTIGKHASWTAKKNLLTDLFSKTWSFRTRPGVVDAFASLWDTRWTNLSFVERMIKIEDKSSAHLRTGKFALVLQICLFFRELITSMDCFLLWRPWMNNQPWKPKTEGLHIDQNPFHKYKTKIWCSILSWSTFVTIIYFQDGSSMRPGNDTSTICG